MGNPQFCGQSRLAAIVLCVLVWLLPGISLAGTFSISPVRIYMGPNERATAITITNEGDTELAMQAELFRWKQSSDGKDELLPTEDVFLTPPIIKVGPKARQVVRLVRLVPPSLDEEITYRMMVREVPEAIKNDNKTIQVGLALAFNLPIFITPPRAKPDLTCTSIRKSANSVQVQCANKGNAHILTSRVSLLDDKGTPLGAQDGTGYLLANVQRTFDIASKQGPIAAGKLKIQVQFPNDTITTFDSAVQ